MITFIKLSSNFMACSNHGLLPKIPDGCGPYRADNAVYTTSDGVLLKDGLPFADIVSIKGDVVECRLISANKYLDGQIIEIVVSQK